MQVRTYPLPQDLDPMTASQEALQEVALASIDDDFDLTWWPRSTIRTPTNVILEAYCNANEGLVRIFLVQPLKLH